MLSRRQLVLGRAEWTSIRMPVCRCTVESARPPSRLRRSKRDPTLLAQPVAGALSHGLHLDWREAGLVSRFGSSCDLHLAPDPTRCHPKRSEGPLVSADQRSLAALGMTPGLVDAASSIDPTNFKIGTLERFPRLRSRSAPLLPADLTRCLPSPRSRPGRRRGPRRAPCRAPRPPSFPDDRG